MRKHERDMADGTKELKRLQKKRMKAVKSSDRDMVESLDQLIETTRNQVSWLAAKINKLDRKGDTKSDADEGKFDDVA